MTARSYVRSGIWALFFAGSLLNGASCYRAEIDLGPFVDDQSQSGGGVVMAGAGQGGGDDAVAGGTAGGAAGAPTCDPTPEDALQEQCRLREPSKQMCDEQAKAGWNGCYGGGCFVCAEMLIEYPYYLARHRCCQSNGSCSVHEPLRCSPLCPPPTELDKRPLCFNLAR